MGSLSKSVAVLVALFAAVPTFLIISWVTWELLLLVNNAMALNPGQIFLALFSGFSFGLAVFSLVYAARVQVQ